MTPLEFADADALDAHNAEYLESLLVEYRRDASRVPADWRRAFEQLSGGDGAAIAPSSREAHPQEANTASQTLQHHVDQLVHAYRSRGHLAARLDPLELAARDEWSVNPERFGLAPADDDRTVLANVAGGDAIRETSIGDLTRRLSEIYCGSIGFEFLHADSDEQRDWLRERIEGADPLDSLPQAAQLQILEQLDDAATFEQFVRKKYVGAKTFSLEGAESLIPLLHQALNSAANQGVAEVVLGMAHRGRLNVLANIVGKRPVEIFREFEDQHPAWYRGRGDVKYHLGASGEWKSDAGNRLHVSLCFNPSHLEFINPVALGRMRAKQDRIDDDNRERGMVVLIHGDAGFAGEGVVQESLNLSPLADYHTGGALHIVINNQLGFTTSPEEGRSTHYSTDVAKGFGIPVFHVNGEDLPAVIRVVQLAMEYRATFGRDVVIDLLCFRRWGHNEADEPSFTQPLMYRAIKNRPSIRDAYLGKLLDAGAITQEEADKLAEERKESLKQQFDQAQEEAPKPADSPPAGAWEPFAGGPDPEEPIDTGVPLQRLQSLLRKLSEIPAGFHRHKKFKRTVERRQKMADGEEPLDWPAAEALAIATLAEEGHPVRLAGQDAARGTFSQRHAVLFDVEDGERYNVFGNLAEDQAAVEIVNSPLSEAGALGFEYGYSLDYPEALSAWEAQYGDFANAGQVIIDQFIASAEDKWRRLSGLVLLLPHGYEGKGPEHSSARLERFLSMAAEDNVQVVAPSTPGQYFHLLRRQVKRAWRKPLVVMTQKSLLRSPQATSALEELSSGSFQRILSDAQSSDNKTQCILLTSSKLYYDLVDYREEQQRPEFAILRIEQFYPLADASLADALSSFEEGTPIRWVQEEPENMGGWPYWKRRSRGHLLGRHPLSFVAREPSASPATGSKAAHDMEQRDLVHRAFEPPGSS